MINTVAVVFANGNHFANFAQLLLLEPFFFFPFSHIWSETTNASKKNVYRHMHLHVSSEHQMIPHMEIASFTPNPTWYKRFSWLSMALHWLFASMPSTGVCITQTTFSTCSLHVHRLFGALLEKFINRESADMQYRANTTAWIKHILIIRVTCSSWFHRLGFAQYKGGGGGQHSKESGEIASKRNSRDREKGQF